MVFQGSGVALEAHKDSVSETLSAYKWYIGLNGVSEFWQDVLLLDQLQGLILSKVPRDQMVMFIREDA